MGDFQRARKFMVDNQLRTSGITDWRILAVMSDVPREIFVPEDRRSVAYSDNALPLGSSRYLSSAAPFARLVQLAQIGPADSVLDIGVGTGYSTAVLAGLAANVTGVETDAALVDSASANLTSLGITNAKVVQGALETGVAGPYSVIVIEGAIPAVPQALFGLLVDGGRLVALIDNGGPAVAHIYVRSGKDAAGRAEFNAHLPPLQIAKRDEQFVF